MKTPIVINLFGPPGSGKSTGAAYIFSELKRAGVNAELVTEYAKDKTWERNMIALGCQEYIFGKQSYRLARCRDKVDVIVTDSPLPLSIIYNNNPALEMSFGEVVFNIFNTYDNLNYYVNRIKPYNPAGRNQTELESEAIGEMIHNLLNRNKVKYTEIDGDSTGYDVVVKDTLSKIKGNK